MEKQIFTNDIILSWLQYYSQNTPIDLEHVKIIDITKKNKIGVKDKSGVFLGVCLTAARSFSRSSSSHTITTEI